MVENLSELCKKASEIISEIPSSTKIRLISHYDADGATAAAIISKALYRKGFDFHVTLMRNPFIQGLERVKKEENEFLIFSDMGSGLLKLIEGFKGKAIIIDHHQYFRSTNKEDILQINANNCGINGNYEACGASLSYAFALALSKENTDLSYLALTGIMGDKQYIGGIRGYNKTVLEDAIKNGIVKSINGLKFSEETLSDSLFYSVDPYFSGLSGNKDEINELLKNLQIDESKKIKEIDNKTLKKLHSYLVLKLLKKGCEINIIDTVIRERCWSDKVNLELERFADLIDACGKGGNRGLALSLCMGDKDSFTEAKKVERNYKQKILDELLRIESEGVKETKSFRYFYTSDSSQGGVIGGIATNFMLDTKKPLISLVKKDSEIHISSRGNQHLVKNGLDLGAAMNEAAKQLGGQGGGHKIAAGATIDSDKENEFLEIVDSIITKQLSFD